MIEKGVSLMPVPQKQENLPRTNADASRILIVAGNRENREVCKTLLKENRPGGFEVLETADIVQALALARKAQPDCILLDCALAGSLEFIGSCKKETPLADCAIIVVTCRINESRALEALKLGAADYISENNILDGSFVQNIIRAIEDTALKKHVRECRENLERSYRALSDFTYTVSQGIRLPLRRIEQCCEILKDDLKTQLGEESVPYIGRLELNLRRLTGIAKELQAYSRTLDASREKEERMKLNFGKIVSEVVDDLEPVIKEHNASIVVGALPSALLAYPARIRELFESLISNAIKFRSGSDPVIGISCEEKDSHYLFSIRDNGQGIAAKYHTMIFRAFESLQAHNEEKGSGLGLAICSKAVDMHNGKIWVESEPGKGAAFKFTIAKA